MKKIILFAALLLMLGAAAQPSGASDLCSGVTKEFLSSKLPFKVDEVLDKQPLPDYKLCQVIIRAQSDKGTAYVTANKQGVLLGNLFVNKQAYAEKAMNTMNERSFRKNEKNLPGVVAFSYKPTGAKKAIYMFTDPDCPACNQTKAEVQQWAFEKKVEVRVVLFPLPMHPAAKDKSIKGICGNMTFDHYIRGEYPGQSCKDGEKKVEDSIRMASELGIDGTPSFIGPTGKKTTGFSRQALDRIVQ
jgi:thiol:disulfide interchange protein DsbC